MKNYIELATSRNGRWKHYVYLDTDEFRAGSLLARYQVHLECEAVMGRPDESIYRLIAMKVAIEDEEGFLKAMEDLKQKMLLLGYTDYETRGGEYIAETEVIVRQDIEETGRVLLPTGKTITVKRAV